MTEHTFQVTLERNGSTVDGGTVTYLGEGYGTFTEAEVLERLLPGGDGPERLDLSLPGYVRWRGVLIPADKFERLEVTLVSKSRPPAPSE